MTHLTMEQQRQWRSGYTSPLQKLPRPVYFRAYSIPAGTKVEPHSHTWCQFLFAKSGMMQVEVKDMSLLVPPQYGMWIPCGAVHTMWAIDDIEFEGLYIEKEQLDKYQELNCRVVIVDDFIRAFIHHASTEIDEEYDESGKEGRKVQVLLDLIQELPDVPLHLPFPADPVLAAMCREMQLNPGLPHLPDDWAKKLNISGRTLSRRFLNETKMTYQAWRQRLRLMNSLSQLKKGDSVTTVALDAGYASTSAYIYAFHKIFGASPQRFLKSP